MSDLFSATRMGLQMVSYQLSTDDLTGGNTIKLPREELRHDKE